MIFNKHSDQEGKHAFLSASKYHWIRYDDEKLEQKYLTHLASQRGTELHELAHGLIKHGVKLAESSATLNSYVNDCIGFRMKPEVVLFYSEDCFGTADAIGFRDNFLRISDLKTGTTPTSEDQLKVYAALFCLEYRYKPVHLQIELRIYQNDEIRVYEADPMEITMIMDKIVTFNKKLKTMRLEVQL